MVDDVMAQQEYDAFFEEVFSELEDKVSGGCVLFCFFLIHFFEATMRWKRGWGTKCTIIIIIYVSLYCILL